MFVRVKGFSSKDFAKYHPGGALGKKLYLRVSDLIVKNEVPKVSSDATVAQAIIEISEKRLGATAVLDSSGSIWGIITDGDVRRMLSKSTKIEDFTAGDIMSKNPKTITESAMAIDALDIMENNNITQVLVVNDTNQYVGVVHLHDILKEGIF